VINLPQVPIESLSYALFNGAVNPIGLALIYRPTHHQVIELIVQNEGQNFATVVIMEENSAVNCIQDVGNCRFFKSQNIQFI